MTFPKMSLNRLLVVWALVAIPAVLVVNLVLHAPAPGVMVLPGTWVALRLLNRRAWKRHFTPRPK